MTRGRLFSTYGLALFDNSTVVSGYKRRLVNLISSILRETHFNLMNVVIICNPRLVHCSNPKPYLHYVFTRNACLVINVNFIQRSFYTKCTWSRMQVDCKQIWSQTMCIYNGVNIQQWSAKDGTMAISSSSKQPYLQQTR